ncbi:MAG: hypothetical protein ACOYOK_13910 [Pseudobdellovibrionaceae bacterium]
MLKSLLSVVFVTASSIAMADFGFSQGNTMQTVILQGQASIVCREQTFDPPRLPDLPRGPRPFVEDLNYRIQGYNTDMATFNCRTERLEPYSYDRFIGPVNAEATQVRLTVNRADGSQRIRTVSYRGADGRTKDALNLWLSAAYEKPLLAKGINKVQFQLLNSANSVLQSGEFTATVQSSGVARQCERSLFNSDNLMDCRSQYSTCQRYFGMEFNNCR